jgi:predicted NBD/HSP70 family sugar kinase
MFNQRAPTAILVVDIGGSKVKMLASGQTEPRRFASGRELTPDKMVEQVRSMSEGWDYQAISIGYPGEVGDNGPRSEPGNLGRGWVGYNFAAAFDKPVRMLNDAAMQALGCYESGRMLFLGLGTGLGSALIAENVIVSLELGQLRDRNGRRLWRMLGDRGRRQMGNRAWRRAVRRAAVNLRSAFLVDDVVLGGGNAKLIRKAPAGVRLGGNRAAFRGGFRLWHIEDVQTHDGAERLPLKDGQAESAEWRLI